MASRTATTFNDETVARSGRKTIPRSRARRRRIFLVSSCFGVLSYCAIVFGIFSSHNDTVNQIDLWHRLKAEFKSSRSSVPLLPGLPEERAQRFPSVQERVKLYTTHWYQPPCDDDDDGNGGDFVYYRYNSTDHTVTLERRRGASSSLRQTVGTDPNMERGVFVNTTVFEGNCSEHISIKRTLRFCWDVQATIPDSLYWDGSEGHDNKAPVILNTSDGSYPFLAPTLQKTRRVMTPSQVEAATSSSSSNIQNLKQTACSSRSNLTELPPILWKLNSRRHFRPMTEVFTSDTYWHLKKNVAIFRGVLSGRRREIMQDPNLDDVAKCWRLMRCRLVYNHANSTLVDAKITNLAFQDVINGVSIVQKPKMGMKDMLKYKALIFLEGNDISSGLKWGLLSRSVVLMPPPTMNSWAMEELLQPYIHYVPLFANLSNVEEQMKWVLNNDKEAQKIAHRGSLWMQDMSYHPSALGDEQAIFNAILQRYAAHFRPA